MSWTYLAASFFLAATMGMAIASLAATMWPEWSRGKRLLVSAAVLPGITLVAAVVLALYIRHSADPGMNDIASAAIIQLGALFTAIAFAGGLAGAAISRRGR
ncbi:MAG: hypothetical protein ABIR63_00730 [Sphingomicrobium sp.]